MVLRPSNAPPNSTEPPRILLADDTPEVQLAARKALQAAGVELLLCNNGATVLTLTAPDQTPPDLIILDSTLPDMSGTELCRRLTLNPQLSHTPILLLKTDSRLENKLEVLEVGAFDFIRLPLDPQELVIRVKAALRCKALRDELRAKSHELIGEHEAEAQLARTVKQVCASWHELQWQQMLGFVASHVATEVDPPLHEAAEQARVLAVEPGVSGELQPKLRAIAHALHEAAAQIHRLSTLVHQAGTIHAVGLAALLQDLVKLTRFETTTLTLELELETGCRWRGPVDQLACALLLLLHNAVEAVAKAEAPRVFITLKSDPKWYCIEIADNGPGLDFGIRKHLFEPFQTTKAAPHVGMGLHFVHQVVERLCGRIEITDAVPPPGAEVTVRLPHDPPDAPHASP